PCSSWAGAILGLSGARARLRRKPDQLFAGFGRCPYRNCKQNPAGGAIENDVAAFWIDASHPPAAGCGTHGLGVKLDGVGVVAVHLLENIGLGIDKTPRAFDLQQKVGWREIEDASEAADVMRALDCEPPKGEVWEVSIEGSLWMAGEKSPPHPLFRILL